MKTYKSDSAKHVVYVEHSTSAIGASLYQSSADPTTLGSLMRNSVLPLSNSGPLMPRKAGLHLHKMHPSEDFDEPLPDDFWLEGE